MSSEEFRLLMEEIRQLRECNVDTKNQVVALQAKLEQVDSDRRRHADIDSDIRAAYRIAKWVALTIGAAVLIACTAGMLAAVKFLIAV